MFGELVFSFYFPLSVRVRVCWFFLDEINTAGNHNGK